MCALLVVMLFGAGFRRASPLLQWACALTLGLLFSGFGFFNLPLLCLAPLRPASDKRRTVKSKAPG